MVYNNLCAANSDTRDLDNAESFGTIALELYEKYMPEPMHSMVLNNLAAIAYMREDYAKAESIYLRSLRLAEQYQDNGMMATTLSNIAIIYLDTEDYDKAIACAEKAQKIAHEIGDIRTEKIAYSRMKDGWHGKRDFAQAYLAQSLELELKREINEKNSLLAIAQAEAQHLQHRLEDQLKKAHKQNAELEHSNRVITKSTRELETKNNLLTATNLLMNRIVSIIAHDVRGPVASIAEAAKLIRQECNATGRQEIIESLFESASATDALINELLHLANRYKSGIEEEAEVFELNETFRQGLELARASAKPKGIKIVLHSDTDPIPVCMGRNRLSLIIRNLMANAIKFSNPDSEINLYLHKNDNLLSIAICDQGMGMSREQIDEILAGKAYSRMGTQQEKGFGIGLVFVLEAVMHTKGKLEIESEPGKGTCFKRPLHMKVDKKYM